MLPVDQWLKKQLTRIKDSVANESIRREVSKLLGKYLLLFITLIFIIDLSAVAMVLHTGCRPIEAAYVVFNKTIVENDYFVKH